MAGELRVPSSKSATNRALLAAALTAEPVTIVRPLESDDTTALRRCLAAMGASIAEAPDGVTVRGPLAAAADRVTTLDAADSGTAARFLTAVSAAVPGRFRLTGSPRLRERPVGELVDALRRAGARIVSDGPEGFLPLTIEGGSLRSGNVSVDASRSSQFFSALVLAGVATDGGLAVRATGPIASAPYVRTTAETLRQLGHEVIEDGAVLRVRRGVRLAAKYEVPGDYSSALPLLAAVAVAGGRLRLNGLRWPSADADAGALPVLEAMGLVLAGSTSAVEASASGDAIRPVTASATDFPDAVPALAAVAAFAAGTSRFEGIAHLRWKESDRLAALAELLTAAGAKAAVESDALVVDGPIRSDPRLTVLGTRNDHRMAMTAAILAVKRPGVLIENPGCVSKSYPSFFRDLEVLVRR